MHTTKRLLRLARPYLHSHTASRAIRLRLPQTQQLRAVSELTHPSLRLPTPQVDLFPA